MDGGFDEWVAARVPSLLRFARALSGSDEAAEQAVRTALSRVWSTWQSTVRTGEPDLRARDFIVRACRTRRAVHVPDRVPVAAGGGPAPDDVDDRPVLGWLATLPLRCRAVVVLGYLEDRPDPEIAEVLALSEASVRALRQRALATLSAEFPDRVPVAGDRERIVRAALAGLADAAPTHLADLPGVVPPPPPRPRRGVWATTAAVLVMLAGVGWITHESRSAAGVITYSKMSVPATWRVESYAGVQLRVPGTWGFGGAPIRADYFPGRRLGACGANVSAVGADNRHSSYISASAPFVGRPAVMTYLCVPWGSDGVMPTTDAVWFGSPMRIGLTGLGPLVAETRGVGNQHVTVFSADPRLRREILGNAETVDIDANGCHTRAVQQPVAGPSQLAPSSLSVCVYSEDTGVPVLLWSGREDASAARRYVAATAAAMSGGTAGSCGPAPQGQWIALGLPGNGGERWDVVDLGCARILGGDGTAAPLRPDTVSPWAHNAIRAYVGAPRHAAADVASYFRRATG